MQSSNKKEKKQNSAAVIALRRKMLLLIASFALLVVLVVAGTAAWYTRVSEVSGMTMDVAQFDFSADYVTSTFLIKAEDYLDTDKKIAPGSYGILPIRLSASQSNVPVDYSLNFDFSTMAPEFRDRLCFYYYTEDKNTGVLKRHYLTNGCEDLKGQIEPGTTDQYEYICWKWIYEITPNCYYTTTAALDGQAGEWVIDGDAEKFTAFAQAQGYEDADALKEAHDEFDTKIGLGEWDSEFYSSKSGITFKEAVSTISAIQNPADGDVVGQSTTLTAIQKAMEFRLKVTGVGAKAETDSAIHEFSSYSTTTVPALYYNETGPYQ